MSEEKKYSEDFWADARNRIKESLPESEWEWLERISFVSFDGKNLVLSVSSKFFLDKLTQKGIAEIISNMCSEIVGSACKTEITIASNEDSDQKNEIKKTVEATVKPRESKTESRSSSRFKPEYTFDNFVPGNNSDFAFNACLAISQNPGQTYNPLLLYGGVGLGKTHLIQAVGNYIEKNLQLKVAYRTCLDFVEEFTESLTKQKDGSSGPAAFRRKYKKVDVLLIDDIQYLEKKVESQTALFDIYNTLYDADKQMIFTSDRPINELQNIQERITSRFGSGLTVDLQPPDYETRVAILRKKCANANVKMDPEVINYIAENIQSNVRDLESCLKKLIAYSEILNKKITLNEAKMQLKDTISGSQDKSGITVDLIIKTVGDYYNCTTFDIKGKKRSQGLTFPRQIAFYLSKNLTDYSLTEIGNAFGGKDHTTVIYSVGKIEKLLEAGDAETQRAVNLLTNAVKSKVKDVK